MFDLIKTINTVGKFLFNNFASFENQVFVLKEMIENKYEIIDNEVEGLKINLLKDNKNKLSGKINSEQSYYNQVLIEYNFNKDIIKQYVFVEERCVDFKTSRKEEFYFSIFFINGNEVDINDIEKVFKNEYKEIIKQQKIVIEHYKNILKNLENTKENDRLDSIKKY